MKPQECLNYEDLWKKIIETQKGEDRHGVILFKSMKEFRSLNNDDMDMHRTMLGRFIGV